MHKRIFCNNSQQMLECRYQASSLKLLAVYDCGLSITSKGLQITVHKGKGSFVLHKSVSSLLVSITIYMVILCNSHQVAFKKKGWSYQPFGIWLLIDRDLSAISKQVRLQD